MAFELTPVKVAYTNYRGETSVRTITPQRLWHGSTEWHPEPQWLVTAYDHDKQAVRDFAFKDLGYPEPTDARDLPFRQRDIERGLILFRTSNNAHDFINFVSLSGKVDALPQIAKDELASLMRNIANELSPEPNHFAEAGILVDGDGWLDINDAPHDGTVVDLWCDRLSERVPNCRWNHDFNIGYPEDGPGFWEQLTGTEWRPSYDEKWFSHYRLVPAAPTLER
ncbi:hypothetical protein I6H96_02570 [Brucella anthropi]|uniref:Uncharacterized protein n=1 Tax=Brucella anthropi (strain ATCC 49188 / DSM 6882 / CCUG 24695 / JCM 21032 / LMG 3331 / NBRC 15819 / NCTC 12168 / Alc 37) TaxID=439375 RepID=A6WZ35_BRUA4|nr:hypothetical protein [Brucella anthropi]ABS14239.1 hypothetical protein Oant_1523 [Brucella anthropi ATCC 49188]QQC25765.1 hypothetical protein I6H96_02570 [Brucella anthropi]SUA65505.1 Uncharacterised protein [Brucella anthropi]